MQKSRWKAIHYYTRHLLQYIIYNSTVKYTVHHTVNAGCFSTLLVKKLYGVTNKQFLLLHPVWYRSGINKDAKIKLLLFHPV
jgi:hypothetical protein